MDKTVDFLQKVDIFSLLEPSEIDSIVDCLNTHEADEGQTLFEQGDEGRQLYIVRSGRVGISIRLPNDSDREIAEFREGDFFGEMSIFENAPRSATGRTKEKSSLLTLYEEDFFRLMEQFPYIAIKIMYRMLASITGRLRNTGEFLSDMVRWGETARKRAITDELTGVYNRRYLDEALKDRFSASQREGRPMSLIMVDLDYFREINEEYGHTMGDQVILGVVEVFKKNLRDTDIMARYGGDEFCVILPRTDLKEALDFAEGIRLQVSELDILSKANGSITRVTMSQGVASYPENAGSLEELKEAADQALYTSKENGRNRASGAPAKTGTQEGQNTKESMTKRTLPSIRQKNQIIRNILDVLATRECFLLLGHENPDEDCISSLIAFALLVVKFHKDARIFLGRNVHEHFQYLLNICRYNSIDLLYPPEPLNGTYDTVVICDTPKPSMLEKSPDIERLLTNPDIVKIEIDHHMGADSEYIGDPDYCLVTEASSASELVGQIALKLQTRDDLLERYQIGDPFSRNLVLAILTGIIGDSKMGQFLKSKREKMYYRIFSSMFNKLLAEKTNKESNFSDKDQVFNEIQRFSNEEGQCFNFFMKRKRLSPSIGYSVLKEADMAVLYGECDNDTIVSVARAIADTLAEESSILSLVVYFDNPAVSDLVQFRMRRSQSFKKYDLRQFLDIFQIENGGGHEGAIGFRIPRKQVGDVEAYVGNFIQRVEEEISNVK